MSEANSVCVIVPVYRNHMPELEEVSFKRLLEVFHSRQIILISPPTVEAYAKELALPHDNVSVEILPQSDFGSAVRYTRLLMSPGFYNRFARYDYLLMCQLDVYVFKDDLDYWMGRGEDYFGAPVFEGYTKPTFELKKRGSNGGVSLRKTQSCLRALSEINFRYSKLVSLWRLEREWSWKLFRLIRDGLVFNYNFGRLKPVINEDMFWSAIVPQQFDWFSACEPEVAMYFAYDTNPKFLFEKCGSIYPMAIHAWWTYDRDFVESMIERFDSAG